MAIRDSLRLRTMGASALMGQHADGGMRFEYGPSGPPGELPTPAPGGGRNGALQQPALGNGYTLQASGHSSNVRDAAGMYEVFKPRLSTAKSACRNQINR